jgi:hypothetical protein
MKVPQPVEKNSHFLESAVAVWMHGRRKNKLILLGKHSQFLIRHAHGLVVTPAPKPMMMMMMMMTTTTH